MDVRRHRIAAGAILLGATLGVAAVGRSMVRDSPRVAEVRARLDGTWVATRVQAAAASVAEGEAAAATTVEFAGHRVRFRNLVDAAEAAGTYVIDPAASPGKVDFKVDAGWMTASYALTGDRLVLCVNALKLPEQLGVPTRGRADHLQQSRGRFLYEFRKATP